MPSAAQAADDTSPASASAGQAAPVRGAMGAVSAVTVTFSDRAQELAAADPRLSPDEVAIAVEHELQAHQLYAPAAANVQRTLAITVQDFTSSLASNATLLGFSFHNVMLAATVQVQGAAAAGWPPFDVHARTRISTRDVGADGGSLSDLYKQFAVQTVADLRGVETPSQSVPR